MDESDFRTMSERLDKGAEVSRRIRKMNPTPVEASYLVGYLTGEAPHAMDKALDSLEKRRESLSADLQSYRAEVEKGN